LTDAVIGSLRRVNRSIAQVHIDHDSSLVDDLGFDSLKMIDLVFALEDDLGIVEFPLQAWWDCELGKARGERFTVGSLVSKIAACVSSDDRDGTLE
jgi:acyl carrier protein